MRLLVITPHLSPDTAPTGLIVSRLVDEFNKAGHEVHVVTSLPWYRQHRVEEEWRGRFFRANSERQLKVVRLTPFAVKKSSLFGRALGFGAFSITATFAGVLARGPFDSVVVLSPPLTLGLAGWLVARRHKCPLVLNVQDVFPDVAVRVGVIRSPILIRIFEWMERFCYRRSQAVTVLSSDLAANISSKVDGARIEVIPNFVDISEIVPGDRNTSYRSENNLGDRCVVMYAGNLGHSQSLEVIIEAARRHRARDDIAYVLNGGGVAAAKLRDMAGELPNLTVVDYKPVERLPEVLATADLHVVSLNRHLSQSSVPSKTLSILASARPVIACVDPGSEVARIVEDSGAGLTVFPEDVDAFVEAVENLAADPEGRVKMGLSGRSWIEGWPSAGVVAGKYLGLFDELMLR